MIEYIGLFILGIALGVLLCLILLTIFQRRREREEARGQLRREAESLRSDLESLRRDMIRQFQPRHAGEEPTDRELKRLRGEINDIHKHVLAVSKSLEKPAS